MMKHVGTLPRLRRKQRPPSMSRWQQLLLLAVLGLLLFFGGILVLLGSSPVDPSKGAAVEIGHGALSVTPGTKHGRRLAGVTPGHRFADLMVEKLSRSEPFTLFAPSDEALYRMSAMFRKYPANKSRVDTILGRFVGYGTVGRRLQASLLAVGGPERLESVVGFPLIVARGPGSNASGKPALGALFVNEERVAQEDLAYGSLVVHLLDGGVGPDEFLDAVRGTDPEDVDMEVALAQEFGETAIVTGGQGTKSVPAGTEGDGAGATQGGSLGDGAGQAGKAGDAGGGGGAQGGAGAQEDPHTHDKVVEEASDLLDVGTKAEGTGQGSRNDSGATPGGSQGSGNPGGGREGGQKREALGNSEGAVQKSGVAAAAEKLQSEVKAAREGGVPGGASKGSPADPLDSDSRNRDAFVREGPALLEEPGESGGEQREAAEAGAGGAGGEGGDAGAGQGDASSGAGGGAGKGAGGRVLGEQGEEQQMASSGWSRQELGLSGMAWWHRRPPPGAPGESGRVGVPGKGSGSSSSSSSSSPGIGFGWLGFGGHATSDDAAGREGQQRAEEAGVNAGNATAEGSTTDALAKGGVQGGGSDNYVLAPDPLDNLPRLRRKPGVLAAGEGAEGGEEKREGGQRSPSGVAVDIRGGLATSRSPNSTQVKEALKPTPAVLCNGRGFVNADGLCICAVLFGGPSCERMADTSKLAIDPYVGPLLWSAPTVAYRPPRKASSPNASLAKQPPHLHAMTMRLLEEISPEERDELEGVVPPFDPLASLAWESCAVVGNSGGLLLRDDGEEIDRHDMVLRFNAAPTVGYEHQVGSKTTLRLSEIEWVGFAERNETVAYHLWLRAQKDELRHLLRFKHVFPDSPPLLVLDMGFSAQILSTLGNIPSTGLLGISFALQKCKRVDVYGFGLSEKHGVRHHYFNRNTTVKGVEKGVDGLDKEFDSLLDLADAELIWVADPCLDDCRRSMQKCSMCRRVPVEVLNERTDWTEQQAMLNAKRELRWRKFLAWQALEKEMQFRKQSLESKRKGMARRSRAAQLRKGERPEEEDESDRQADLVDWGKLVREERLDELPLSVLLTYFRRHQVTIPDTKKQMLLAVKNHYYFSHGQLHKQTNRLYRPSD